MTAFRTTPIAKLAPLLAMGCAVIAFIAASARAAPVGELSYDHKMPVVNKPGLQIGAYDPHGDFKDLAGDTIEHLFLPWQDVDLSSLTDADAFARARGRSLLITVEPWSWAKESRISSDKLRAAILTGEYDQTIAQVCGAIGKLHSATTIRWAHEMDASNGQFTWSRWAPNDYIAAYRRFVTQCREKAPKAQYMWSPLGEADMNSYYPGDAYVDSCGLTVLGLQQFDRDKFGHDRTFAEILAPAYKLATAHCRTIVVAEAGYAGDAAYVRQWSTTLNERRAEFPRLTGVVYFDQKEVYPWPAPYGLPDWRVVAPTVAD
jgi:beta-mannanase